MKINPLPLWIAGICISIGVFNLNSMIGVGAFVVLPFVIKKYSHPKEEPGHSFSDEVWKKFTRNFLKNYEMEDALVLINFMAYFIGSMNPENKEPFLDVVNGKFAESADSGHAYIFNIIDEAYKGYSEGKYTPDDRQFLESIAPKIVAMIDRIAKESA